MASPVKVLTSRWFMTLLGVILLCLLIWFAGPYFAFADAKPLVTATGRLVLILIVFAIWALVWQWKQWREARAGDALVAAAGSPASKDGAAPAAGGAVGGADGQLAARFEEAMAALRKSSGGRGGLLELPWYVIIGPPGAGKTTLLANSGLEFPLADRFGKAAVRGVGGTRSCDWWFTTSAILLDTAGRYTTQDSDATQDQAGWSQFLALLKKARPRRPINGVLLAISVADVAGYSDAERERHVLAIRRRLEDLHRQLGVRLPVYVMLTKADLIAGFSEYFDDLDQAERAQVWGVSFPWDASREGNAHDLLGAELDALIARLAERVADRLQGERDPSRRRALFAFPQQVASLKGGITSFVREIFASSTLDDRTWLRGVYLTSGTQEGTPIDRMMGALARTFGLGMQATAPAAGQGKAFFIGRLLREVVFGEAGLAGSDRKAEFRLAAAVAAAYLVVALAVVLAIAGLAVSYRQNTAYIDDVVQAAQPLKTIHSAPAGAELADTVPSLDAVRQVLDHAARYRDGVPWGMRFGLYQGDALTAAAEDAYFREMNVSFGPAVARDLAGQIATSGAAPDRLYEYLKLYLMMAEPARLTPAQAALISHAEWSRLFAKDPETGARVAAHFDAYTAQPKRVQPAKSDAALVAQARVSLQSASVPLLMYARVRMQYAGDTKKSINLERELGLGAGSVMVRRSGRPLSEPVPALYTRAAFDEFNLQGKPKLVEQFMEDAWVLGDRTLSYAQSPRLAADVVALYEQDYIRAWDALLADLTVRPARDTPDHLAILSTLSSPTSPLKRLLVLTEAQTNLTKPPPAGDVAGAATAKLGALAGSAMDKMLGTTEGPKPGAAVTAHFAPMHALVAGSPAPIDAVLAKIGDVQKKMQAALGPGAQPTPAAMAELQAAVNELKTSAGAMPGVGPIVEGQAGASNTAAVSVAHSDLENRYQTQVAAVCRELVGNRYPLNSAAANDATLDDFARTFGTGGVFDAFFQANLAPLVDTSRPTWRWREGVEGVGGSASMLAQFQAAERIRQLYFKPGGQAPEVRFTISPDYLDQDVQVLRLDLDGQHWEDHNGPPTTGAFAWPGGPVGSAVASVELRGGAHPQLAFQGPWAIFRLLDQASLQAQSDTRFIATLRLGGKQARVVLQASSTRNPFARPELTRFRCG